VDLDRYFDETEEQLSDRFEVRHLPLLLTFGNLGYRDWDRAHYWLTFNNVVIENGETAKNVVMSTYSQDSHQYGTDFKIRQDLEQAAEQIWRDVGFDVHLMDGLEDLAYSSGSIHCMTKDLRRAAAPARS
jgi:hypothetical protein